MFTVVSVLEASNGLPQKWANIHAVMPASQKSAAFALGGPHIHMSPIWPAFCKQMHSAVHKSDHSALGQMHRHSTHISPRTMQVSMMHVCCASQSKCISDDTGRC